ncbi:hypothetical protein BDU57DRAFT_555782 [Ampelomyces quisqualis]|uniref:Fungal-specific transcription factor domain-containing protein n=1 Tax=Ampelomyces quisqualis TaxID=50730 RepID=A0A6A5QQT5_AMPQU|nr:hypothetical protein BDU57DRAFT_555782 [Ampelomyces quisqualis]
MVVAVQFLDESSQIRSQYTDESPYLCGSHEHSPKPGSSTSGPSPDHVATPPLPVLTPTDALSVPSLLNIDSPGQPPSHGTVPMLQAEDGRLDSFQHAESITFVYQQPPGQPILWPLEHEQEAMLLQHYIENVALFFDMVDPRNHFGVHVVQRAKKNSTLMNAILALSARQLSRTTDFDPYIADAYYQRCFDTLIPALNENVAIKEESLLAATIILRLLEEMNISVIGSDPQGHLFGTQAIIRAAEQSYAATTGPNFRQAIYWAAFRQELWISLMTQRAFQLHIFPADRSLEPANDSIWATRTIAHLADVCNFAFGQGRHSIARYSQLMDENESWKSCRPDSFDPFFNQQDRDGSGRGFPDIRFHEKSHVMGAQYNTLAHMLLVVHDPAIPQLGPAHKHSRALVERIVQEDVRTLCGVALSNHKVFPCIFVACFAIALVGDRFTMRDDQEKLRDLWLSCERSHGFPPTATIHQLEDSWGWHNR